MLYKSTNFNLNIQHSQTNFILLLPTILHHNFIELPHHLSVLIVYYINVFYDSILRELTFSYHKISVNTISYPNDSQQSALQYF